MASWPEPGAEMAACTSHPERSNWLKIAKGINKINFTRLTLIDHKL
jgi:hypothetical protein